MSYASGSTIGDVAEDTDRSDLIAGIGPAIKAIREQKGLTRSELASASGVSESMLAKAERGANLSLGVFAAVGRALGHDSITSFAATLEGRSAPDAVDQGHAIAIALLARAADLAKRHE